MNIGDLGRKAKELLDTDEGEKRSDAVLDRAAELLDEKTGGRYTDRIAQGRDAADEHIGRTGGDAPGR